MLVLWYLFRQRALNTPDTPDADKVKTNGVLQVCCLLYAMGVYILHYSTGGGGVNKDFLGVLGRIRNFGRHFRFGDIRPILRGKGGYNLFL